MTIAVLSLVGASTVACSSSGKSSKSGETISVLESTPGFNDIPLHVAADDFAAKNHIKINIITTTGGGTLEGEFTGGVGTIALTGADAIIGLAQKQLIKGGVSIIGSNSSYLTWGLVAKKGSSYTTLADLKGTKVGITGAGAQSQAVLTWALKTKADLDQKSVTEVALGSLGTIEASISNGSVVAGMMTDPGLSKGLDDGEYQLIMDFRDNLSGSDEFQVRTNDLKANPDTYKNFLKAYNSAVDKLESDQTFALSAAKQYWGAGLTADQLQSELTSLLKEMRPTTFTEPMYDSIRDIMLGSGIYSSVNFPTYAQITDGTPKL